MSSGNVPSEPALLVYIGDLIIVQVIQTSTYTLIYGAFFLLYLQCAATYIKKKRPSKAQFWMFLLSTTTFLLATVHEAAFLAFTGIRIHSVLVGFQSLPLGERLQVSYGLLSRPNSVLVLVSYIESVTSDIVVIWRAFVLLSHQRRWTILPCVPLLGSIASYIAALIFSQLGSINNPNADYLNTYKLDSSGFVLSLASNAIATALIGYVYWNHRKNMNVGLGRHHTTRAERALALLLESGVVFCLLQALAIILQLAHTFDGPKMALYANTIVQTAFFAASAMYPTMIIVLMNNHRTMDYIYSTNKSLPTTSEVEPGHLATLEFVRPRRLSSQESD